MFSNPIWPGEGGGGGAQRPRYRKLRLTSTDWNETWHESYGHKSIPDARFESGNPSSFGDMTSQGFPRKKGISHKIQPFTLGKRV